jgi:hypothetical protein
MIRKVFGYFKRKFRAPVERERVFSLPFPDQVERPTRTKRGDAKPKNYAEKRKHLRAIQKESRRRNRVC